MSPCDDRLCGGDHKHVLLVTSSWPRFNGDYAGIFVKGFAHCLTRAGWQVTVACPDYSPDKDLACGGGSGGGAGLDQESSPKNLNDDAGPRRHSETRTDASLLNEVRVRYHLLRSRQRLFYGAGAPENLERNPLLFLQAIPFAINLWRVLLRELPGKTHLISHWLLPAALLAGPLARSAGVPHLALAHSSDVALLERLARYPMGRHLVGRVLKYVDVLWVTGAHLKDRLDALLVGAGGGWERFADKSGQVDKRLVQVVRDAIVMPMGVDLNPVSEGYSVEEALSTDHKAPIQHRPPGNTATVDQPPPLRLLVMGRLVPIKGVDLLLEAVGILMDRAGHGAGGPGCVTVDIVGDGPERERLVMICAKLGIRARFLGSLAGPAKDQALAAADLVVIPSRVLTTGRREGTPLVLLEAFASGKPVIASRSGGIEEVLLDGVNGLLVEPGDSRSLADAIGELCQNRELMVELGVKAKETAARFSWDQVALILEDTMDRLDLLSMERH